MNTPRLNQAVLANLPTGIERPPVSSGHAKARIVHLGIGAFHRAHQAIYTQQANLASDRQWHIIGASLRSGMVRDQLAAQDYLYQVVSRDGLGQRSQLVDVVQGILVAPEDPQRLVSAMADPLTAIVSLTVTEKGYCHVPGSGRLDLAHGDIQHDLDHPDTPRSAPGFIVAALQQRYANNIGGLTILSCDNLPNNGQLCRELVIALARQRDPLLGDWIEQQVSFPSTMVDRIAPAADPADRQQLAKSNGYEDQGAVFCEPFSQWVIEDRFVNGRPAWESAGALLVDDVAPYETMKLRLLNGCHSSMAYLGILAGHEYIHQTIADTAINSFVRRLMDQEITPCLSVPCDFDLDAYKGQLRQRFANPALQHRTVQVAMDGTQKLPQRLLLTLRHQLQLNGDIDGISIAVAAWMAYIASTSQIDDPLAVDIKARLGHAGTDASDIAATLLDIEAVFDSDLPRNTRFTSALVRWLDRLQKQGVQQTLRQYLALTTP